MSEPPGWERGAAASERGHQQASLNAVRLLAPMLSEPANRSCAECRVHLADTSQIYASFGTGEAAGLGPGPGPGLGGGRHRRMANGRADRLSFGFEGIHARFAPPLPSASASSSAAPRRQAKRAKREDPPLPPPPPLGVFVCQECSLAHIKTMDQSISVIKPIQSGTTWSRPEVDAMLGHGGNRYNRCVYEAHLPPGWSDRRPRRGSSVEERERWCLAKYAALAFVFPRGALHGTGGGGGSGTGAGSIPRAGGGRGLSTSGHSNAGTVLPNRLVDYFCVVGGSGKFERHATGVPPLRLTTRPSELRFEPEVIDRYPKASAYRDGMAVPAHLPRFVFPEGCRPRSKHLKPTLFPFVLTAETGTRLYGAAMHVHDKSMGIDELADLVRAGLGEGEDMPVWLRGIGDHAFDALSTERELGDSKGVASEAGEASIPEVVYVPQCLVLLSHYPFHDVYRAFLKQIYMISLVESPLPIERFICNFVSECPLPPLGKIEVRYQMTGDVALTISRPPENRLPMARFGHRPLFAALSAGNIMVLMGVLLQEGKIALCATSYAMLGAVAEALVSLIFPFVWQGMYIPVMPYSMLDILDAPVPFLVGISSKYLSSVSPARRPQGVVFVDLDEDIVHLGVDDSDSLYNGGGDNIFGRPTPHLPDKDAAKLKSQLEKYGGNAYLPPKCGIKGRITYGHDNHMPNAAREHYARECECLNVVEDDGKATLRTERERVLTSVDLAFFDDEYLSPVKNFVTETGTISDRQGSPSRSNFKMKGIRNKRVGRKIAADIGGKLPRSVSKQSLTPKTESAAGTHLLEMANDEDGGMSESGIRGAFFRFFVSIMKNYERFINEDKTFEREKFVSELDLDQVGRTFANTLLSSQMFERFLEERINNPDDFRFLDESIVAKNNRSVKKAFAKGGRKNTPFLADEFGAITETFIPPPPSNWGLPDDGRMYKYVSFPSLRDDLYGKIRPPKRWEQVSRQRRSVSSAALLQQQSILSKVLVPSSSPKATKLMGEEARSLEWAINLLSLKDLEASLGPKDVDYSQNLVLSSNEKQRLCISGITKFQSVYRTYSVSHHNTYLRNTMEKECSATAGCVTIQRFFRGYVVRRAFTKLRTTTISAQALFRGRRIRFAYRLTQDVISDVQAQARGWLTRRNVFRLRRTRVHFYRTQMFELWRHARVPLAYRSTFWSLIDGTGYLHFSLIEKELSTLWETLNMDFSMLENTKSGNTTATSRYHRYLIVEEYLEAARPEKDRSRSEFAKLVPVFPAELGIAEVSSDMEKSQFLYQASELLTLDRIRIYERLCTIKDKEATVKMYEKLNIPVDAKEKKKSFAEQIWMWHEHADISAELIFALFPEAKGGSCIPSRSVPTRKAKKRFGSLMTNFVPPSPRVFRDGKTFVQSKIDELVKSDLRDVALALILGIQAMYHKTNAMERKADVQFNRQRDAIDVGCPRMPWCEQKFLIIENFLHTSTRGMLRSTIGSTGMP